MRVLVTGAKGMVGSAVKEVFEDYELILTDIDMLDIRDYDVVMSYAAKNLDIIIHLAAETNLEKCQNSPDYGYYTNHTGTTNLMLLAKKLDIPIVYISTAGIFDGDKDTYNEWDTPGAINHYGRSKWFGEISLATYDKVWIFRAGWMMGGGPSIDKKFVNIIYKQIKSGKKLIYAVDDCYGSPTYTYDLASTIKNVIEHKAPYGTYSCGGVGVASRCDVAKAVVEFLGADVTVTPVNGGFFKKDFFCARSKSEVLENIKLNALGLSKMRGWRETIKEYINKCYTL